MASTTSNRAVSRADVTAFCRTLGYDPKEVLAIEASAHTVSVTAIPAGISGIEGVTTVHMITDVEGRA